MQAVLHILEGDIRQRVDDFAFEGIDDAGVFLVVLEAGMAEE